MAAGLGTRFGAMTETMPKGFIEAGGKAMVVRSIETLLACGISRIIIGTGYHREAYEALAARHGQIECITHLLDDAHSDIMLITPVTNFQDQYYVEHDKDGILTRCSTDKTALNASGELVGIHKLSSAFYRQMCREYEKIVESKPKLGYEYQLLWMSQHGSPVFVLNAPDVTWYEIDDADDLAYAEEHIIKKWKNFNKIEKLKN